jgi:membrane fusion protein (multidrug efflux system)
MVAATSDVAEFTGSAPETATKLAPPKAPATKKRALAPFVLAGLALAAAAAGTAYYAHGMGRETTDDAQVEGHVMNVAARISGQVDKVLVRDNQMVEEGDLLVQLDASDLDAKAQAARADVAAAQASLDSARAQLALADKTVTATVAQAQGGLTQASATVTASGAAITQGEADVAAAQARYTLAQADFARANNLVREDVISKAQADAAQSEMDQAKALLDEAKARLASARASARGSSGGVMLAQGRLAQALTGPEQMEAARAAVSLAEARLEQTEAALRLADLNVSFTQIRAPHRGLVSRRTVEPGQMVGPDKPLLSVVPLDDVWIVANFKEDQLADVRPGQPATVTIDAFGSRELPAHVDSIAGASGARFALLPPDNASGNYVKVVQRVPVLVRLDGAAGFEPRPGMSANVTIRTKS